MGKYRYSIRRVEEVLYNSHADYSEVGFTNGLGTGLFPSGHSDKHALNGAYVLCMFEKNPESGFPPYRMIAMAKIKTLFDGRPDELGRQWYIQGHFIPPSQKIIIYDEREDAEFKGIPFKAVHSKGEFVCG